MIDQIKIGKFLRQLRKEKGLTQETLAEKFGVSTRSISRWENGSTMPELGILVELADYYQIDLRELINGERKNEIMDNETKEVLKSAADYAKQEKKLTVRRKCIVAVTGTLFCAIGIFLGITLLPALPDAIKNNYDRIFGVIGCLGLFALWATVIHEKHKSKKEK